MCTIRKGTVEDAAGMAEIFNHYIATSTVIFSNRLRSREDMEEQITPVLKGDFPFYVAESDGRVLGYCFAHLWLPDPVYSRCWELTEYLSPDAAGHGIGSRLMENTIRHCREQGAHSLVAFVTEDNAPCIGMLTRAGFTHVGTLPETGFKFGRWLGDAIFQKILH